MSKAFDRVHHQGIWNTLTTLGIQQPLVDVLRSVYLASKCSIDVNGQDVSIEIRRGVRQGDVISPRLFTTVLDVALRELNWSELGIRVNGKSLSHLLFADDCLLFAPDKDTLKRMIKEFMAACGRVGLEINMAKSEYMTNKNDVSPLQCAVVALPPKQSVKYLGVTVNISGNWDPEISRRISSLGLD